MNVNIVIVKHQNCDVPFVFRVPEDKKLEVGDYILCETKKSPCEMGRCITPSFWIIEEQLISFYGKSAASLKPITGKLNPQMFLIERTVTASDEGR